MALVIKDRVKETTITTGNGTLSLGGAASGFQSFVTAIGNGNTTYYAIEDANGTAWEVGIGTISATPDTLTRTTLIASSTGAKIELTSGTHTVFGTYSGSKAVYLDASGGLSHTVDLTSEVTGTLPVANGGTGLTSIATLLNSNIEGTGVKSTGETGTDKYLRIDGDGTCSWQTVSTSSETFKTISVSGQDDVVADSTTDTLTIAAGSNVTITTTAASDTITIASADTNTQLSTEQVQDIAGPLVATGGTKTLITVTYDDTNGDMDFVVDNDLSNYSNSSSSFITASSTSTLTNKSGNISQWTNDSGYITATLTDEQVQDKAGAMFSGNTETLITATYQDSDGTIDLVVDNNLANYDNSSSGFLTSHGLTFGIADTNAVKIDGSGSAAGEYAKFTSSGIVGEEVADVKTDLSLNNVENTAISTWAGTTNITTLGTISSGTWSGTAIGDSYISSASTWNAKQAALTFGIADTNAVEIDGSGTAAGEYAKFTSSGIVGEEVADVKTDLSLNNVENTALSTWAGTGNITTLGTISTGVWNGTAIAQAYIANDAINGDKIADDAVDSEHIADGAVDLAHLSATGTKSSSTYLRGDNTWATVSGGGGGEANEDSFKTISVSGQDDVVADTTTDTLTLAAGSNVTITTTAASDTVTIAATDTNTMGSGFTVSATTDSNATTITQGDDLMFTAGTGITCETTADGTVTISSTVTDTNTQLTQEQVEDYVDGLLTAGSNVSLTYDDAAGTLTIASTDTTYSIGDGGLTTNDFTTADHNKLNAIEASADVTDATNVTAAGALMDSEVTNLAQVKAFDSSDYATAAQGTKADSAQQPPTEGAFVDGDKTKLDGIAASANNYTLPSASLTVVGGVELATTGETTTGTDTTRAVTPAGVQAAIDALIDGAPGALDTLNELAAAINDDASYASTITTALGLKAPIASPTFTGTIAIPNVANLETAVVANTAKVTNVSTDLGVTTSTTTVIITSSDGTNATIPVATTSIGGVMSKAMFDEHTANVAKNTNVATNLSKTVSGTGFSINSSDGDNVALSLADTDNWGLMSDEMFDKLDGIEASATVDQTKSDIDGLAITTVGAIDSGSWTATDIAVAHGGTGASSAADARTNLGVDAAGTDNSTAVTLAGSLDYITISGQEITRNAIDLAADVTGELPASAVQDKFLRNDGSDTTTGTVTAGGFTTTGTWTFDTSAGGTTGITNINVGSAFTDDDVTLMSAGAIKEKIEAYGYTTNAGDMTGVDLTAGTGITIDSETNTTSGNYSATITCTVTDTNTTYTAGTLLDLSSTTFNVDLSEASAAVMAAADEFIFLDNDDSSAAKRESLSDLLDTVAGTVGTTGLDRSGATLVVSDLHPVGVDGSANQLLTDDGDGTVTSEANLTFDGSTLTTNSGIVRKVATKVDANYTMTASDHIVLVDTTGDDRTITLPSASASNIGQEYTIKKIDSGTGMVNIVPASTGGYGPDDIDQYDTKYVLYTQHDSITFVCGPGDATATDEQWWITSEKATPHQITIRNSLAQSIATGGWRHVEFQDTDAGSVGCTFSTSTDKITIARKGRYLVSVKLGMGSADNRSHYLGVAKNQSGTTIDAADILPELYAMESGGESTSYNTAAATVTLAVGDTLNLLSYAEATSSTEVSLDRTETTMTVTEIV